MRGEGAILRLPDERILDDAKGDRTRSTSRAVLGGSREIDARANLPSGSRRRQRDRTRANPQIRARRAPLRPPLTRTGYGANEIFHLFLTVTGLACQKPSNHHIMSGQCWVKFFTPLAACPNQGLASSRASAKSPFSADVLSRPIDCRGLFSQSDSFRDLVLRGTSKLRAWSRPADLQS